MKPFAAKMVPYKGGRNGATLEESCRNLIDAAKRAGGPDNVTAVLMRKTG